MSDKSLFNPSEPMLLVDERDAAISAPSMGDVWFNTDLTGGGMWEKHTGDDLEAYLIPRAPLFS